jgi:hypothetical protein
MLVLEIPLHQLLLLLVVVNDVLNVLRLISNIRIKLSMTTNNHFHLQLNVMMMKKKKIFKMLIDLYLM